MITCVQQHTCEVFTVFMLFGDVPIILQSLEEHQMLTLPVYVCIVVYMYYLTASNELCLLVS